MYHTTRWSIGLCLILTGNCLAYNYPSDANTMKPCARRKNTILTQGSLCEWDVDTNSYFPQSVDTCTGPLKNECPEFNQASCEWNNGVDSCKLRYYAKDNTWMEVFYGNQYIYGDYSGDGTHDIVELHRMVDPKYEKDFGKVSQPNYPDSFIDRKGLRGLKWIEVKNPKKHNFNSTAIMCRNGSDVRCSDSPSGSSYQYLKENYPDGFDPTVNIPRTPYEDKVKATIEIITESKCRDAMIDSVRVPTCTTYYRRYGVPADNKSAVTQFIFLESQLIFDDTGKFRVKFAYWNIEDVGIRDLIFKDKDWKGYRVQ